MALKLSLVLILLLSHVHISFAPSGGSAGGSGGGSSGGGGAAADMADGGDSGAKVSLIVIFSLVGLLIMFSLVACIGKRSILVVQVGLSGEARSLQKHINETAKATNTSSKSGWHHILTDFPSRDVLDAETTGALLQNSEYAISAYSSVEERWSDADAIHLFNYFSKKEHDKFDIDSLVNFNNLKIQKQVIPQVRHLDKDYMVVTILVATNRVHKLPAIESISDMKETLQYLNSITVEEILAVEVLWTPQDEKDNLSEQELLQNYPCLKPIDTHLDGP